MKRARFRQIILLAVALAACSDEQKQPSPQPLPQPSTANVASYTPPADFVALHEVHVRAGLSFRHHNGATGKRLLLEMMGAGVTVLDFDGDGLQDLYCVDSGVIPATNSEQKRGGNRLFRNLGAGRFQDVTTASGAEGRGYMMGAVAGDYDNDGDQDLYVTAIGSNSLLQNIGGGKFRDVTVAAQCDDQRWNTSAAFLDFDNDGHLDLFVLAYLEYEIEKHRPYFQGDVPAQPPPGLYDPLPGRLFRNRGDGTFEDVTQASGIGAHKGKGLGVATGDFDDDGDVDIYCANDVSPNFLFANQGDGTFREIGAMSGAGYSAEGREESGMGVDAADFDGDGRDDLVVTNFSAEANSLYRNEGGLFFTETSSRSGTRESSMNVLGFGVRLVDFDNDGARDLIVANGHIYDNTEILLPGFTYLQPPLFYRGLGNGRFRDVLATQPDQFRRSRVARGLATIDFDDDGDLDVVFGILDGETLLFENVGGERNAWISVRCVGTRRDSTALGARVTVEAGGRRQSSEVRSGASYLAQSDLRQFFGLGALERVDRIVVRWPGGAVEEASDVAARRHYVFREGAGLVR